MFTIPNENDFKDNDFIAYKDSNGIMTLYDKHDINNPIKGKLDDNEDFGMVQKK